MYTKAKAYGKITLAFVGEEQGESLAGENPAPLFILLIS